MRVVLLGSVFLISVWSHVSLAQPVADPVATAQASGVCAPFGVAAAAIAADGTIRATCNEDATAFVPLIGALAPVLGAGAGLALAAVVSAGNATPDTQ
ncbi:hypothetical protein [Yoonia sp.]|uniref:hypothetical protein n=1 Tax=Yoonia sp. TaxID=2212373 RepID=UPI003F6B3010